jgi:hypothetical protein
MAELAPLQDTFWGVCSAHSLCTQTITPVREVFAAWLTNASSMHTNNTPVYVALAQRKEVGRA